MMASIDLDKRKIESVTRQLATTLADLHLVYGHLHALHWNVEGTGFLSYHRELQTMYEQIAEFIDDTAERILTLGNRPPTKLKEYLEMSDLDELSSRKYEIAETIDLVLEDLSHMIGRMRELVASANDANDEGTADFSIQMLRDFEKARWFWSAMKA